MGTDTRTGSERVYVPDDRVPRTWEEEGLSTFHRGSKDRDVTGVSTPKHGWRVDNRRPSSVSDVETLVRLEVPVKVT